MNKMTSPCGSLMTEIIWLIVNQHQGPSQPPTTKEDALKLSWCGPKPARLYQMSRGFNFNWRQRASASSPISTAVCYKVSIKKENQGYARTRYHRAFFKWVECTHSNCAARKISHWVAWSQHVYMKEMLFLSVIMQFNSRLYMSNLFNNAVWTYHWARNLLMSVVYLMIWVEFSLSGIPVIPLFLFILSLAEVLLCTNPKKFLSNCQHKWEYIAITIICSLPVMSQ